MTSFKLRTVGAVERQREFFSTYRHVLLARSPQRIPAASVAIKPARAMVRLMGPSDALLDHLKGIYAPSTAGAVASRLAALLDRWRPRLPAVSAPVGSAGVPLTERDALLITYADQVREEGRAPLQTLGEFAADHLAGVISGLHLLPFYPSSSDDGFAVKDFYAVDPACGTWDDIRRFRPGFDLMFDAVFNHMSAQGAWFQKFAAGDPAFRDFFVSVEGAPDLSRVIRPRALPLLTTFPTSTGPRKIWTTFSADQVDLNLRNPEVLLALIDVLLFYVSQGATYLRLDAIAFLWKQPGTTCLHLPQTHHVIQLLRAVVEHMAPRTLLITETNVPHVDNLSYFGDGTNEAHLVYNFALPPLVLHAFATGDARKLTDWARSLELPSPQVTFFNFLASHDGIGINPARGLLSDAEIDALVTRTIAHGGLISYKHLSDGSKAPYELNIGFFEALSDPAASEAPDTGIRRCLCAHAIQCALAGLPGIYFHSLFGSRGDRTGAESSGIPRRINRQKLERGALERELADPTTQRARVFAGMCELLRVRRGSPAFHPAGAQEILVADSRVFAVRRVAPDGREEMLCVHNVSGDSVAMPLPAAPPGGRRWRVVLGATDGLTGGNGACEVVLGPHQLLWACA